MLSISAFIARKNARTAVISSLAAIVLLGVGVTAASAGGGKGGKPDRTPPTISFSNPSGSALTGSVTFSGIAADNVRVTKVELRVDAGPYQLASGTAAWQGSVNTAAFADGPHTITARATDGAGNATPASVSVTFKNASDATPPVIAIALPQANTTVAGTIPVAGSASDNLGLAKVEISVDGGSYQPAVGTNSWDYSLNTTTYSDGGHTVLARATDKSGNVASTSEMISVQNATSSGPPAQSPPMSPGTIGGYAFQDPDRDGVYQTDEHPLGDQRLYLFSATGTYLSNTLTNAEGWYQFVGLADGNYVVKYTPDSWWAIRHDWAPDTTGSVLPDVAVQLSGTARADFGWRPIVRSSDPNAPISTYVGPNGLTVKSYDDVVPAQSVFDRLMTGSLVGHEAPFVTVRFDYMPTGSTTTAATGLNGVWVSYHATSNVSYLSWLDHNGELFHEYGHAWSLYCAYMVQQDPTLTAYLQARGVLGDPRIGTSYAWNPREMIAEDYRELFGDANARADGQINRDVPLAQDVPGLRDFLAGAFMRTPTP